MQSLIDTRPFPPVPPAFNLAGHVLALGRSCPEKPALVLLHPDRDEAFSYREVTAQVLGAATALLALGLRPGDRVLMRLQNGLGFPVVFLGAIAAGLVPVATSAALTVTEVTRLALRVDPRLSWPIPAWPCLTTLPHALPPIL